jgi:hypothetical protein
MGEGILGQHFANDQKQSSKFPLRLVLHVLGLSSCGFSGRARDFDLLDNDKGLLPIRAQTQQP